MTLHGLTVGQSCPEPGGIPIEDYDEDENERLVEVDQDLVKNYLFAEEEYQRSYRDTEAKKFIRDTLKAQVVEALQNETGTATVGGDRRLSVRVSPTNRIDTKRLRAEAPDIARMYETESLRSSVKVL